MRPYKETVKNVLAELKNALDDPAFKLAVAALVIVGDPDPGHKTAGHPASRASAWEK